MPKLATARAIAREHGLLAPFKVALSKLGKTIKLGDWVIPGGYTVVKHFLGTYEKGVKNTIEIIKPKTFITAGAWPCDYVALAWDLGAREIIGFEPDPENYAYCLSFILRNLKKWDSVYIDGMKYAVVANRYGRRIQLYRLALWNEETTLRLKPHGEEPGQKGVAEEGVEVKAVRLDEVIHSEEIPTVVEEEPPCLVLLDVEGSELQALEGARNLWGKCRFIIEVWKSRIGEYEKWLVDNDFAKMKIFEWPDIEYWLVWWYGDA